MDAYARMLDKRKKPTEDMIAKYLGAESTERLRQLENWLGDQYTLNRELRFPFGDNYGWGYKYSHGRKHLCYVFFEEGAFTVTLQLGDTSVDAVTAKLPSFLPKTQELWATRYPFGERGGWLHYRVLNDAELQDACTLTALKVKPYNKGK